MVNERQSHEDEERKAAVMPAIITAIRETYADREVESRVLRDDHRRGKVTARTKKKLTAEWDPDERLCGMGGVNQR
ncbi:hypothetical protein KM043_012059 [Ampulex compressa]|nr:hypothetical protein KM043_012059 [Ampulex compressa]